MVAAPIGMALHIYDITYVQSLAQKISETRLPHPLHETSPDSPSILGFPKRSS